MKTHKLNSNIDINSNICVDLKIRRNGQLSSGKNYVLIYNYVDFSWILSKLQK